MKNTGFFKLYIEEKKLNKKEKKRIVTKIGVMANLEWGRLEDEIRGDSTRNVCPHFLWRHFSEHQASFN